MQASQQQLDIVKQIGISNVVVNSAAGAGKTTTIMYLAQSYPDRYILNLTYNARLKFETRERAEKNGIDNLEVHSYHSFCVKYIYKRAYTDTGIKTALKNGNFDKVPVFDIIIIDEAQDLIPLYHKLTKLIIYHAEVSKILVIGDQRQTIYQFKGADNRFITMAPELYGGDWKRLNLDCSFRVTHEIANFVNRSLYGRKIMSANKSGTKPQYVICDPYSSDTYENILPYITTTDTFILAPSLRSAKSPVINLSNYLTENGYNVYVPNSDTEKPDQSLMHNKVTFLTFHQSKGLERKNVIVFGFDISYFKFFARNEPPEICPNTLYVACTRAKENLILLKHYKMPKLPFLEVPEETCDPIILKRERINALNNSNRSVWGVTDILRHLRDDYIDRAIEMGINIERIREPSDSISTPQKIKMEKTHEYVADIIGVAIPIAYEYERYGAITSVDRLLTGLNDLKFANAKSYKTPKGLDYSKLPDLLKVATICNAAMLKMKYKLNQFTDYEWVNRDIFEKCLVRLRALFDGRQCSFEVLKTTIINTISIYGAIDCICDSLVYELKCKTQIENKDFLQLLFYMNMMSVDVGYLYNVRNDEYFKITCENSNEILEYIIEMKFQNEGRISDSDFIKEHS